MEIFTKNSAKCTIFQSNNCNNFSSLMLLACCSKLLSELQAKTVHGPMDNKESMKSSACRSNALFGPSTDQ
jgi:hypothetical protein